MIFSRTNLVPCLVVFLLVVLLLFTGCQRMFGGETETLVRPWIVTNALGAYRLPPDLKEEADLTPSVANDETNSVWHNDSALRVKVRSRERLLMLADGNRSFGGKLVIDYDLRSAEMHPEIENNKASIERSWKKASIPLLKASYSRGRVYFPGSKRTEWVSVLTSDESRQIVIVYDQGPVECSNTSGRFWDRITEPADYVFTLSSSPKGSELIVVVSITNRVQSVVAEINKAPHQWYVVAPDARGDKQVFMGGSAQGAPVLTISRSLNTISLSWSSSFSGYILQSSTDIHMPSWVSDTNKIMVIGARCVVNLPVVEEKNFFRLILP